MTEKHFRFLLRMLHFDNIDDWLDKFAAIRDIYEAVYLKLSSDLYTWRRISDCRWNYSTILWTLSISCIYAEEAQELRSKDIRFRRFSIEIRVPGQQPAGPFRVSNTTSSHKLRMVQPVAKFGRSICMDNFFMSFYLYTKLYYNKIYMLLER